MVHHQLVPAAAKAAIGSANSRASRKPLSQRLGDWRRGETCSGLGKIIVNSFVVKRKCQLRRLAGARGLRHIKDGCLAMSI
jgi:hypothetical protein